ncbi:MAG: P-loop NTPase fold protein [Sulfuricurvum sp.]|uniref:KAP family P-loop NTPase fold protein n=1 Tax=Sulfuricurvum sp. TaxID=2025608 RepID=UPI0026022DD4|nr:P-loop NTPase fold protein [Sulfuricurvum sp.]MDD2369171.1 P-loop NTPase fold protein [Sulfuricurvum sp.]MDD2950331.1 P-loop NTPase fold protein [Sulfuricurvum sp.]MDD5117306.1 P-loop NTPase fold protein [Sulfuricurvum sp.]
MEQKLAIWEDDLLNRKKEGKFLSEYLLKRYSNTPNKPFVLNINAEWGFGKTYFLKNLSKELATQKHPVIYFDAWQNDYSDQPLLAFISEMNTSLKPFLSKSAQGKKLFDKAWNTSKKLLMPILVKKFTGLTYDQLMGEFDGSTENIKNENDTEDDATKNEVESVLSKLAESALSDHETVRKSITTFKENMAKLLSYIDKNISSKQLPMFIFIDELDRCRPNYAIELLENIKHIFDIPGIMFVIATDSKQLSHSINAVYGQNFASERYLKRFFDQEYNLTKPDNYAFAQYLFELHGITKDEKLFSPLEQEVYKDKDINVELFTLYASFFKLGLRDQEQVATVLSAIVLTWQTTDSIHLGYLLFLIMLKQCSNSYFYNFKETVNTKKGSFIKNNLDQLNIDISFQYKSNFESRNSMISTPKFELNLYSLNNLIELYTSLLDIDVMQLYNLKYNNISVHSNVIEKMISDTQKNNQSVPNLNIYLNLVLQAGQFS